MEYDVNISAAEYLSTLYKESMAECEKQAKLKETPADIVRREEIKNTLDKAESLIKLGILCEEAVSEYHYLDSEISAKKLLIKRLYGIEAGDLSLIALNNAKENYTISFSAFIQNETENLNAKKEEFELECREKLDGVHNDETEKISAIENEISVIKQESDKEFLREQEEYDYSLQRSRKAAKDVRAAVVAERENELHLREKKAEADKEECINRIAEIDAMQKAVDEIPLRLEEARKRGAEKEAGVISKSFAYARELEDADHKHKLQSVQSQYENLKAKYEQICAEILDINERLDKCNAESRKLTSDTVRSIGGINILNAERKNRVES